MKLIKTLHYLNHFYDIDDAVNGLFDNRYTFKQKNQKYLHVTIYKENGKLTLIHKKARMNNKFTRESLINFLSDDVYYANKKNVIQCIKSLSKTEKKFLSLFSKKYNKFIANLPTVII